MADTRGKLIVVEGIDGCGKGTQVTNIVEYLKKFNCAFPFHDKVITITASEPSIHPSGKLLRQYLGNEINYPRGQLCRPANQGPDEYELAALFTADRVFHCQEDLEPWLSKGVTVILDRYYFSTFAYQGMKMSEAGKKWLVESTLNCPAIIKPDMAILIDISAETAMKRIEARGRKKEIFESVETLDAVRDAYLEAFDMTIDHYGEENFNFLTMQNMDNFTPDQVFSNIAPYIAELF